MGTKRDYEPDMDAVKDKAQPSPFIPMFEVFGSELDEHHDRRERITKASRDITAASKKMWDVQQSGTASVLIRKRQHFRFTKVCK